MLHQQISHVHLLGECRIVRLHRGLHRKGVGEIQFRPVRYQRLLHKIQNLVFVCAPTGLRRDNRIAGILRKLRERCILRGEREFEKPLLLQVFFNFLAVHIQRALAQKFVSSEQRKRPGKRASLRERFLPVVPTLNPEHILSMQGITQILDANPEGALGRRRCD